jgi:hypothetical protein
VNVGDKNENDKVWDKVSFFLPLDQKVFAAVSKLTSYYYIERYLNSDIFC